MDSAPSVEGARQREQEMTVLSDSSIAMKGEASVLEMDSDNKSSGTDKDTIPLLSPPVMLPIEHEVSDTDGSELEKGGGAACRICLESEPLTLDDELISPCMCKGTQQLVHRACLDHWRSVKEGFAFSHCTTCKAQFHLRPELPEDYSWRKIKFKLFVARDVLLVFLAVQSTIALLGGITYLLDYNGQLRDSFSGSWDRILSNHPIPFYYCVGLLSNVGFLCVCLLRHRLALTRSNSKLLDMPGYLHQPLPTTFRRSMGVFLFFLILGIGGMVIHCLSIGNSGACLDGCRDPCYAWGCFPASMEACGVFLVVFVILFAILGVAYGLLAATMAVQRIWQRHYHILTKRVLTKEYIVEDMHGEYEPPTLAAEHASRLRSLNLL